MLYIIKQKSLAKNAISVIVYVGFFYVKTDTRNNVSPL